MTHDKAVDLVRLMPTDDVDLTLMIREGQNLVGQNDHRVGPRRAGASELAAAGGVGGRSAALCPRTDVDLMLMIREGQNLLAGQRAVVDHAR
jgi:hypothetical protein